MKEKKLDILGGKVPGLDENIYKKINMQGTNKINMNFTNKILGGNKKMNINLGKGRTKVDQFFGKQTSPSKSSSYDAMMKNTSKNFSQFNNVNFGNMLNQKMGFGNMLNQKMGKAKDIYNLKMKNSNQNMFKLQNKNVEDKILRNLYGNEGLARQRIQQQKKLNLFGDKDRDGKANILDCNPLNKFLQGPGDEEDSFEALGIRDESPDRDIIPYESPEYASPIIDAESRPIQDVSPELDLSEPTATFSYPVEQQMPEEVISTYTEQAKPSFFAKVKSRIKSPKEAFRSPKEVAKEGYVVVSSSAKSFLGIEDTKAQPDLTRLLLSRGIPSSKDELAYYKLLVALQKDRYGRQPKIGAGRKFLRDLSGGLTMGAQDIEAGTKLAALGLQTQKTQALIGGATGLTPIGQLTGVSSGTSLYPAHMFVGSGGADLSKLSILAGGRPIETLQPMEMQPQVAYQQQPIRIQPRPTFIQAQSNDNVRIYSPYSKRNVEYIRKPYRKYQQQ